MMKRIAFLALFLIVQINLYGQNNTHSLKNLNLEGDIDSWFNANSDSANIKPLIGPLPIASPPRRTSNVFFIESSRNWNEASMTYDNQFYNRVRMKYDLDKQIIYILNPLSLQPVTLNQDLVNWIKSPVGTFKPRLDDKGYYLIIYDGKSNKLIKESSKNLVIDAGEFEYKRTDNIYWLSESGKKPVRNAKAFPKLFPNHKKEIKRYMRQKESREIKRTSKEQYLIHIAEYCDNLSTQ